MLGRGSLAVFQGEVFEFPPLYNDYRTKSAGAHASTQLCTLSTAVSICE